MINVVKDMLLIEDQSVFKLYQELMKNADYFVAPMFTIALILEYFGEMNFKDVLKKLFVVIIFMSGFYTFHTKATQISLKSADVTLKKISPSNLFVKRLFEVKVRTKRDKSWSSLKDILVPSINDFLGTTFFFLAKIFLWLLKLIYSSVYHLTYVFAGITALLYFLGWTKDSLKGTVQASLWCILMPFVIVAILALVGNSITLAASNSELIITKIDNILWLFGVTLLLLISPLITYGMIKGDGIHSFAPKMGSMVVSSGLKAMTLYPLITRMMSVSRMKNISPVNTLKRMNSKSISKSGDKKSTINNKAYNLNKLNQSRNNTHNSNRNNSSSISNDANNRNDSVKVDHNKSIVNKQSKRSSRIIKPESTRRITSNKSALNSRSESKVNNNRFRSNHLKSTTHSKSLNRTFNTNNKSIERKEIRRKRELR